MLKMKMLSQLSTIFAFSSIVAFVLFVIYITIGSFIIN